MAKGYWVIVYRSVSDPEALKRYAALAGPAITAAGGRFLARGMPARSYEDGKAQRCVVTEFASLDAAIAAYESSVYQEIAALLKGTVERDVRIVEGV